MQRKLLKIEVAAKTVPFLFLAAPTPKRLYLRNLTNNRPVGLGAVHEPGSSAMR